MDQSVVSDSNASGVSWAAVIAGAFVAAALSLILLALGTGIGLSAISPWENSGASAPAVGAGAIVWFVLIEIIASSMGGYLAGRLRVKWTSVHTHEVYFRDTAHGFLVWAVGVVITAGFLASAATAMVGGAARGRAMMAESGSAPAAEDAGPSAYFVDKLLRPSAVNSNQDYGSLRSEAGLILANAIREGNMPAGDRAFLAQVVAARTGMNESDAEKRVDDVFAQAREAADKARKAVAHAMYWTFLALLVGAFCASFAATIGGKQRDHVVVV
ncbi:MAG: hypothetical protein WA211_02975 [Candidatus Acidiferrales bacterium]